ncbi:hypothetical protein GUJ93_ZPchr0012g18976 [Zizania palustris]|uniref:Uncharacterized protein n=1 Tax=Zizania palustris TaxID=103762 RepID=A0A8J5WJ64_ZIZPA|nr:hypothetical protein GUJ93_ZPchr0012g18976 [Zizania palustris]
MRKQRSSSSPAAVSVGKLLLLMVMVISLVFALHTASVDAGRAPPNNMPGSPIPPKSLNTWYQSPVLIKGRRWLLAMAVYLQATGAARCRHSRDEDAGGTTTLEEQEQPIVVHRTVKETSGSVQYPMLMKWILLRKAKNRYSWIGFAEVPMALLRELKMSDEDKMSDVDGDTWG